MKPNLGTPGRLLRFGIAIILLVLAWYWHSWLALLAGIFVLYEAAAGWCILKSTSCPKN